MARRIRLEYDAPKPALVLFWPVADGGLWDPVVSLLVESLEEDLDAYVTCVGSGRGALGLNDAAAAARFMGCTSMVVIAPEGVEPPMGDLESASARLRLPVVAVQTRWSTDALAESYRDACRPVPWAA